MKTENFSKTKIKICGLRRREDILAVNEANPDYCGFIVEFLKSFRSVTADEVRELVKNLSPEIQPVGVFVNASMELVRSLLDDGTLAMAQLHGQENESYIAELKAHTDKPVIKAFSIKTADDMENALQLSLIHILMLFDQVIAFDHYRQKVLLITGVMLDDLEPVSYTHLIIQQTGNRICINWMYVIGDRT